MRVRVKTHLSPGLVRSAIALRTTTSMQRGVLPAGISLAFSCTRVLLH